MPKIRIIGDILPDTERYYEGPSIREACLTAAQDWFCAGHYDSVKTCFEIISEMEMYDVLDD